jgi:amino acid permease
VQSKGRNWKLPGWLRRAGVAVLWCLAFLVAMLCVNALGVFFSGEVGRWQAWAEAHANLLFIWRCFLYAAIAAGWVHVRQQVLRREADPEISRDAQWRLARIELTCIAVVVLMEAALMVKGAV